jgi:hypothetical protein
MYLDRLGGRSVTCHLNMALHGRWGARSVRRDESSYPAEPLLNVQEFIDPVSRAIVMPIKAGLMVSSR